jgi:hypothetical protein
MGSNAKTRRSNFFGHQSGQAMVEFMLVIVFIFVLFVSLVQVILLMYAYNTLADAAKEGVRYAIVHGTGNTNCSGPGIAGQITCPDAVAPYSKVQQAVLNFASVSFQNISSNDVTVSYNPSGVNGADCNKPGCMVQVTVSHNYNPLFGFSWPRITLNAAAQGTIMN